MKCKYKNEHLRKQVETDMLCSIVSIFLLLLSLSLIAASLIRTNRDLRNAPPVNPAQLSAMDKTLYSAELTEVPEQLWKYYYMVRLDGGAFVLHDIEEEIQTCRETGHASAVGRLRYVGQKAELTAAAAAYYRDNAVYPAEDIAGISDFVLECDVRFQDVLLEDHPVGLTFGITFLIAFLIWEIGTPLLNTVRHLRPRCGRVRYTPEEIDGQAELPESEWLHGCSIYVTPEALIGVTCGMTAVEYGDIRSVTIRSRAHTRRIGPKKRRSRRRTYYTYTVTVRTAENKRMRMYYGEGIGSTGSLREALDRRCGDYEWIDKR